MTEEHCQPEQRRVSPRAAAYTLVLVAAVLLGVMVLAGASAPAAAQQDGENNSTLPEYYGNASEAGVGNQSWMEGNENGSDPSAIFTYAGRVGSYVIGGDGSGSGPLLTGMLLLGAMLGLVVGVPVGLVGGGVLSVLALFGVVAVGLAPTWLLPVAIFGVGMLLASTIRGVFR